MSLEFTEDAYDEIAQLAFERRDTGARALKSIVEKHLLNAKFEVPGTKKKSPKASEIIKIRSNFMNTAKTRSKNLFIILKNCYFKFFLKQSF